MLTADRGVICNSVKLNTEKVRPTDVPRVSHSSQSWVSTINSIDRTHSWRFTSFSQENCSLVFRLMQLVRTRLYYEYCCRLDLKVTYSNTYMMSFFVCPTEVDLKSVVINYCIATQLYTIYFGEGHNEISCTCYAIFMQGIILWKKHSAASKMWYYWRTVKQFPRVELLSDLRSTTICIEISCMMSYFFGGEGKLCRRQPRKRLYQVYTLLYLVHVIAVCSVAGRIATILLDVLLHR